MARHIQNPAYTELYYVKASNTPDNTAAIYLPKSLISAQLFDTIKIGCKFRLNQDYSGVASAYLAGFGNRDVESYDTETNTLYTLNDLYYSGGDRASIGLNIKGDTSSTFSGSTVNCFTNGEVPFEYHEIIDTQSYTQFYDLNCEIRPTLSSLDWLYMYYKINGSYVDENGDVTYEPQKSSSYYRTDFRMPAELGSNAFWLGKAAKNDIFCYYFENITTGKSVCLYPCIEKSTNKVGVYDNGSDIFIDLSSLGFTAGPALVADNPVYVNCSIINPPQDFVGKVKFGYSYGDSSEGYIYDDGDTCVLTIEDPYYGALKWYNNGILLAEGEICTFVVDANVTYNITVEVTKVRGEGLVRHIPITPPLQTHSFCSYYGAATTGSPIDYTYSIKSKPFTHGVIKLDYAGNSYYSAGAVSVDVYWVEGGYQRLISGESGTSSKRWTRRTFELTKHQGIDHITVTLYKPGSGSNPQYAIRGGVVLW